jgi:hypothetical protein
MEMIPVESSQLSAVGYDADTLEMQIRFAKGQVYSYRGVPQETYDGLVSAPSVGQFFNANVKYGFQYTKLS